MSRSHRVGRDSATLDRDPRGRDRARRPPFSFRSVGERRAAQRLENERGALPPVRDFSALSPRGLPKRGGAHRSPAGKQDVERLLWGLLRLLLRLGARQAGRAGPRPNVAAGIPAPPAAGRQGGAAGAAELSPQGDLAGGRRGPRAGAGQRGLTDVQGWPSRAPARTGSSRTPLSPAELAGEHPAQQLRGEAIGAARRFREARLWYHQWGCIW